jgi:transposase
MNTTTPVLLALDIGARKHAFASEHDGRRTVGTVANDPQQLRAFLKDLMRPNGTLQVLMEATGIYYLDVALIAEELGAQVSVINPRTAHNFAKALGQRSKTDALDAVMLLDFLKRMPFTPWQAPAKPLLELRHYGRYLVQLTEESTAARNRLHALSSTTSSPAFLRADLKRSIASLERRIERIRAQAMALIKADEWLKMRLDALLTIIGVAEVSAIALLSELAALPSSLSGRACVSHAGLDPRLHESGTSVHKPVRISRHGNKYLRRALFHPAMAAARHDPMAAAFRQRLLDKGKKKLQAVVAIMRKLLTAAWALVRNPATYKPEKLYAGA